jgi:hypothetical protein
MGSQAVAVGPQKQSWEKTGNLFWIKGLEPIVMDVGKKCLTPRGGGLSIQFIQVLGACRVLVLVFAL